MTNLNFYKSEKDILYSKSGVEADWRCPRYRYWGHEYQGVGLAPQGTGFELFVGQTLHDGLAAIANGVDIEDIANAANKTIYDNIIEQMQNEPDAETFAREQSTLVEGLLRGFNRYVWPRLMEQFPTIRLIEKELIYKHDGLVFMAKPDLIVEDREGNLWYIEYKSTSNSKDSWVNSWTTAVQLHSSIRAAEQTLGESVMGVIVQGLYKGYVSYGKQGSPFCYAYHKPGAPPFTQSQWSYEYKAGFKKYPVWEMDGGVAKWVEEMPESILSEQFPQTPPIFVDNNLVDAFFRQRAIREHQIAETLRVDEFDQELLDKVFPQRFDQCNPSFGRGCMFRSLCFGNVSDPLESGYKLRNLEHRKVYEDLVNG